jgi:glycosyltransferase involved in cell wall biosynthesis
MNILHTETLDGWGGQQNKIIKELIATRKQGHQVFLLCNPNTAIGVRARDLKFTVYEYTINRLTQLTTALIYTLRLIRKLKIDVLITHSSSDSWMGGLAGRLSRGRPVLIRERHNLHTIVGWPSSILHRRIFHRLLAVSDAVRDYLVHDVKVKPERVLVLNSVVDVDSFDAIKSTIRQELNIPMEAKVFGMFSILRVNKGIYDFLEIVKRLLPRHSNTYAVFGGKTNPHRIAEFTQELKAANVDPHFVRWTGFRSDVANVMKGYDVFVFPSHTEGWPNALMEAMAASLPIVAYDIRPMSDLINNGENGFIVPFKNLDSMAECVDKLLVDVELRRRISANSHRMARLYHDVARIEDNIREILRTVTHG